MLTGVHFLYNRYHLSEVLSFINSIVYQTFFGNSCIPCFLTVACVSLFQRSKSGSSRTSSDCMETQTQQLYFPNLSVLDLSHNLLSVMEKDIALLSQLTELRLAHNDKLVEVSYYIVAILTSF